ncbi:MAG: hypothetical protein A2W00_00875 [Candidatus Eisenbacteria bacterium RBG_16_71_46]|nr:MAG: hypothetical protein A2W00_00875 [Candidatus Eisenbacteria bacterium RBG_16_71_46]
MRAIPGFLVACGLLAAPVSARALDLPIHYPEREAVAGPAYRGDVFEIRLAPAAARLVTPGARGRALGVAAVDRAAAGLGEVRFVPEFRAERRPPAGSDEIDFTAFYLVELPPGTDLPQALERFRALADVASADPIAVLPVSAVPNDSLWSASWWFFQPSRADLHAPEAWSITSGDTAVVVAVIDTGILPYHPDLGGSIAGLTGQMWVNRAERDGLPGVDDDGNGFVDDVSGWDFVNVLNANDVSDGEDWRDEDDDPNDFAGHGTEVAGLIGAITDNLIGVAGTSWKLRLMPVRAGWSRKSLPEGYVDMSYAAQAVRYATRNGAAVINCSFASQNTGGLDAAVTAATAAGVVVVAAAGNSGQLHYLGDREDVIAVAATDANDVVANFSLRGTFVDLAAPGVGIASTALVHAMADSIGSRQPAYREALDGTSFSAPLAAGAVALLQAQRRAAGLHPLFGLGPRLRLRETADEISALNVGSGYGTGRLNLARALGDPPTSTTMRVGSTAVGAAVVLPTVGGMTRVVLAANAQQVLMLDVTRGDTLWSAATSGAPVGHLAAADLGATRGIGLFVATTLARAYGWSTAGVPLPGFPVTAVGSSPFLTTRGLALGDLDGDGAPEVVMVATDGEVFAWHTTDGSGVANFPVELGVNVTALPALADLDQRPGDEIIVAAANGDVHVLGGDGGELAGWPVALGASPRPPVVTLLRRFNLPTIFVPAGSQLFALAPNGTLRFNPTSLGGTAGGEPALGDFDGDGYDEVVVATTTPNALAVFDSLGLPLGAGWPRALTAAPLGAPVLGHLEGSSANDVMVYAGVNLLAFAPNAVALPSFPKPGNAGVAPSVFDLDGDGRTEVVAGTGATAELFVYDAGAATWNAAPQAWPTARGNYARTGSRLAVPALPVLDDVAPAPVADLAADSVAARAVRLTWTAPGDDGTAGRAAVYDLRYALQPIDATSFAAATPVPGAPAPDPAGTAERFVVTGLAPATAYHFALETRDEAGNRSGISNDAAATTGPAGPLAGRTGIAVAPLARPSGLPVQFYWQIPPGSAPGPRFLRVYDLSGRLRLERAVANVPEGIESWDGRDRNGYLVPPALYFVRLVCGAQHAEARVVLIQ